MTSTHKSTLHFYVHHIRWYMVHCQAHYDSPHERPVNVVHLRYLTAGTCNNNGLYNLSLMCWMLDEEIQCLFMFPFGLHVRRFREAVRWLMGWVVKRLRGLKWEHEHGKGVVKEVELIVKSKDDGKATAEKTSGTSTGGSNSSLQTTASTTEAVEVATAAATIMTFRADDD